MRKLILSILFAVAIAARADVWTQVAVQDKVVSSPTAFTYRFGAPFNAPVIVGSGATPCQLPNGCWTTPAVDPPNTPILANPAKLGNPIPNTLKVLQVLETNVAQTFTISDSTGSSTIVVSADPALAPPVIPAPTLPTTNAAGNIVAACPTTGTYAEIAGSIAVGGVVTLPVGTTYSFEPMGASCITVTQPSTTENMIGNLDILRTVNAQIIPILKKDSTTDLVNIPELGTDPTPPHVFNPASVPLTFNNHNYNCVAQNNVEVCTLIQ